MMTTANTLDRLNGLRTLELTAALIWLSDQLVKRLGPTGSRTVSTISVRSLEDQEIIGISQILLVMYPLAIELALKSLWNYLHPKGSYEKTHNLAELFSSLHRNANNEDDAKEAQQEARRFWTKLQLNGILPKDSGSLDDFLIAHANDFSNTRYYKPSDVPEVRTDDLKACLLCIIAPLVRRDPETFGNFAKLSTRSGSDSR